MPMPGAPLRSRESGLLPGRRRRPVRTCGSDRGDAGRRDRHQCGDACHQSRTRARNRQDTRQPAPPADVKVVGASPDSGRPCDEQTWPYIDRSCLTVAKEDKPGRQADAPAAADKAGVARRPRARAGGAIFPAGRQHNGDRADTAGRVDGARNDRRCSQRADRFSRNGCAFAAAKRAGQAGAFGYAGIAQ